MRHLLVITLIFTFLSCENIFTTSAFAGFQTSFSDMTSEQKMAAIPDIISSGSNAERDAAIDFLASDRPTITESSSAADREEFVDSTLMMAELASQNADLEGAITTLLEGDGGGNFLDDVLNDTDRIEDLQEAAGYMTEAYAVDPDSLSAQQLVIGGAGLVSDIMQDPVANAALEGCADLETATLAAAGFTVEEIDDIQTANAMIEAATSSGDLPAGMSDSLTQGLPF